MANATVVRRSGGYTLETTIPAGLAKLLRIGEGDLVEWEIEIAAGQKVLFLKKHQGVGLGV